MRFQIYIILLFLILVSSCKKEETERKDIVFEKGVYPFIIPQGFEEPINDEFEELRIEKINLGKELFFDPILSINNDKSCASCHKPEFAYGDNLAFSLGINGAKTTRNTPALFNLAWSLFYMWDGRAGSLQAQAILPIENPKEMGSNVNLIINKLNNNLKYRELFKKVYETDTIKTYQLAEVLGQFEISLISSNSNYDKWLRGELMLDSSALRGMDLISNHLKGNCVVCHSIGGPFTSFAFRNIGLDEVSEDLGLGGVSGVRSEEGKFKTPSLRNLKYTGPYMHDGRFNTLREVIEFYNSGWQNHANLDFTMRINKRNRLNDQEIDDIIHFLEQLNDEEFVTKN